MNRKYIAVEQMIYPIDYIRNRMQKVIAGEQGGISKRVGWQGGGSFVCCELMQHNEAYIERIQNAKTTKNLLTIWNEMQEKAFISYKLEPKAINENISGYEKLSLDEQKRFLIEILDKNQLYANYSEIDDKDYDISETDKKLNRKFYGEV
jgi:adenine-specific DNA-methyltransferase